MSNTIIAFFTMVLVATVWAAPSGVYLHQTKYRATDPATGHSTAGPDKLLLKCFEVLKGRFWLDEARDICSGTLEYPAKAILSERLPTAEAERRVYEAKGLCECDAQGSIDVDIDSDSFDEAFAKAVEAVEDADDDIELDLPTVGVSAGVFALGGAIILAISAVLKNGWIRGAAVAATDPAVQAGISSAYAAWRGNGSSASSHAADASGSVVINNLPNGGSAPNVPGTVRAISYQPH